MEWVEKIFNCMELFYGDRWSKLYQEPGKKEFYVMIWHSGLTGLTYEQIKSALILCKKDSSIRGRAPPHAMEFFRMAKESKQST